VSFHQGIKFRSSDSKPLDEVYASVRRIDSLKNWVIEKRETGDIRAMAANA